VVYTCYIYQHFIIKIFYDNIRQIFL
jgi:hypothetical protein